VAGLEGDAAAHKALLAKLSGYLRAYFKGQLARTGRGPVDSEDLVQETLIALHTRRHTYDRSQLLTPWVYAIARYKLVDYLRLTKASMKDVPIEEADEVLAHDDPAARGKRGCAGQPHVATLTQGAPGPSSTSSLTGSA
jgi:RNA polymerase sigma-70 factor (ECF subfamily)